MTDKPPQPGAAEAFWAWFGGVAGDLASNLDQPPILEELDRRVRTLLNGATWELGPGTTEDCMIVVSPDGDPDLLPKTKSIVEHAPPIPGWELWPARPRRGPQLEFTIQDAAGRTHSIDASSWRYVLYKFPDGSFDLVLEQGNLSDADEDLRYSAATVLLDGTLGEEQRLSCISGIEPVAALAPDQEGKAGPIANLAAHLASML